MVHTWLLSKATADDSGSIAALFTLSWTSPFARLQFGHVNPTTFTAALALRIAQQMELPNVSFMVIRNSDTLEVISAAQWTLPADESTIMREPQDDQDERQAFEDELYRTSLPMGSNKDLIMESTIGLRNLKRQVIQGQKHYALDNLTTHPSHRGQGFASRLIEWIFPFADADNALVFLETASDNSAVRMYRRLGFAEEGRHTINDLGQANENRESIQDSSSLEQTHVGFVRYPKRSHET